MVNIEALIYTGIGIGISSLFFVPLYYITNLVRRLKTVEEIVLNFPTPEEMAKQLLKVKLPANEIPPDVLAEYMQTQGGTPPAKQEDKRDSIYIG